LVHSYLPETIWRFESDEADDRIDHKIGSQEMRVAIFWELLDLTSLSQYLMHPVLTARTSVM
jgi:hypothetical protein